MAAIHALAGTDGYNWTLDRRVYLKSADELEYVVGLIEQSYKNVL